MSWLACQWALLHNTFVPKFLAPSLLSPPFSESSFPLVQYSTISSSSYPFELQLLPVRIMFKFSVFYESLAATMEIVDDPSPLSHLTLLRLGVHASGAQLVEIACTLRAREALPLSTIFYLISP